MIYVIIGLGLLFMAIGFMVTEKNAKYLLAGYNTMKEEDRKKVDIKGYLQYFKKFHIYLGVSFTVLGVILAYFVSENAGGIFLAVYPILAYIYFFLTSSKYAKELSKKGNKIGVAVLIGSLILVIGLLVYGFKENKIFINDDHITIEGFYGEMLSEAEIQRIELVDQLPEITLRTNGFALGSIRKGYFKTKGGDSVKLILNSDHKPIILLIKTDGKKIYYSAKDTPNEEVLNDIKKSLPLLFQD